MIKLRGRDGQTQLDGWVQIQDGRVHNAHPALTYTRGWTLKKLRATAKKRGWTVEETP